MNFLVAFVLIFIAGGSWSLPPRRFSDQEFNDIVEHEKPKEVDSNTATNTSSLDELGIEYNRYLQQVIDTLEKDESFKKKLESAPESDIRTAKIAEELEFVDHHVRSKLDELKRTELQRLRELARQVYGSEHGLHLNPPGHMDHENTETFEVQDLKKLIHQVAQDLGEADEKRKRMFKQYEMQKHFEREQKLGSMNDEEKKKFLLEEEEVKKKEQEAKKRVHHPGSKQQLEEVWEEQDHMNKDDFNPKTFFVMHDVDGNGFLDEEEVKSLFLKELDKLYSQGMPQADLMERAEEMERMREHVFKEVDKNRDRLISWEEFHEMSLKPEFNEDPGWKPIDEQQVYTQEELLNFERQRLAEMEQLKREGKLPPDYHIPVLYDQMNNSYYAYHPGMNGANMHPAYYQQIPMQHPLHSQDALHGQQQSFQQYQQHPQFQQQHPQLLQSNPQLQQQHPQLQLQHPQLQQQHPQFQQQHPQLLQSNLQHQHPQLQQQHPQLLQPNAQLQQQHPQLQQQHPQLQQQHPQLQQQVQFQQHQQQYQQFQPLQQQQFHQPQFQPMQGISQQPGVMSQSNFGHLPQAASEGNLVHSQQPEMALQNVHHQPHMQLPVVSQHASNLGQQPVNALPQQLVVSQQPALASNVNQQQVVPQQVNLAQQPNLAQQSNLAHQPGIPQQPNIPQPSNVPQEGVADQLPYQSQSASHQAAP